MNVRCLTVGIVIVLLWASAGISAKVKSKKDTTTQVMCSFSATFAQGVETHIDTNGDQLSALLDQAIMNCNIGRFFITGAAEYQAPLSTPETCPAGTLELQLQQARGVGIEEETGDQLFVEYGINGLTLCANQSDGTITSTGGGTYAGGTGQFEGVSGSFTVQATGKYLVTGMKEGVFGAFGQYTGTSKGEFTLPAPTGKSD
jgi:hypothetical protein